MEVKNAYLREANRLHVFESIQKAANQSSATSREYIQSCNVQGHEGYLYACGYSPPLFLILSLVQVVEEQLLSFSHSILQVRLPQR